MYGNGRRTVGTTATPVLRRTAAPGQPEIAVPAPFAAVPGSTSLGTSAPPTGTGTPGATAWAFGWGGRLPLEFLPLCVWGPGAKPLDPTESGVFQMIDNAKQTGAAVQAQYQFIVQATVQMEVRSDLTFRRDSGEVRTRRVCKIALRDGGSPHGVKWRFCARGRPLLSAAIATPRDNNHARADRVRKIAGEAVPVAPPCPGDFAHPTTL